MAKAEYRHTDQYRESVPSGSYGRWSWISQAIVPLLIAFLVLLFLLIIGVWAGMNYYQYMWEHNPRGVLAFDTITVFVIVALAGWRVYKAVVLFELSKQERLAGIEALRGTSRVQRINAKRYGFNAEYVNGSLAIRSIDPKTGSVSNEYNIGEEEEDEEEPLQIEGPKMVTLSELLADGRITQNEATSLIGFEREDGSPLRGKLFEKTGNFFNSLFVVGDPDFGKSTLGVYLAVLTIVQGGRLIVIDPQAELEHSLTEKLGPLLPFCICHAGTPEDAEGAIRIARQELSQPGNYPVLLLIDEFSELQSGFGEWAEIGPDVVAVAESFARTGRKLKRRTVVFGQISTAKRTGGTEFRNVCSTVAFHLKVQSAQNVLDEFDKLIAPTLAQGEIVLVPALQQSHTLRLPYPDKDGLERVASLGRNIIRPVEPSDDDFGEGSEDETESIFDGEFDLSENGTTMLLDAPVETVEGSSRSLPYPLLSDLQITQFVALYPLTGIEKALKRIDGCNHRHWKHAKQIVAERNLKRKEA